MPIWPQVQALWDREAQAMQFLAAMLRKATKRRQRLHYRIFREIEMTATTRGQAVNPKPFLKHMMCPFSKAALRVTSVRTSGIWCEVVKADQQSLLGTVTFISRNDSLVRNRGSSEFINTVVGTEITLRAATDMQGVRKTEIVAWEITQHALPNLWQNDAIEMLLVPDGMELTGDHALGDGLFSKKLTFV